MMASQHLVPSISPSISPETEVPKAAVKWTTHDDHYETNHSKPGTPSTRSPENLAAIQDTVPVTISRGSSKQTRRTLAKQRSNVLAQLKHVEVIDLTNDPDDLPDLTAQGGDSGTEGLDTPKSTQNERHETEAVELSQLVTGKRSRDGVQPGPPSKRRSTTVLIPIRISSLKLKTNDKTRCYAWRADALWIDSDDDTVIGENLAIVRDDVVEITVRPFNGYPAFLPLKRCTLGFEGRYGEAGNGRFTVISRKAEWMINHPCEEYLATIVL